MSTPISPDVRAHATLSSARCSGARRDEHHHDSASRCASLSRAPRSLGGAAGRGIAIARSAPARLHDLQDVRLLREQGNRWGSIALHIMAWWRAERRRAQDVKDLQGMTLRELADIGIGGGEIRYITTKADDAEGSPMRANG